MTAGNALFRFPAARRRDPAVEAWVSHSDPLHGLVEPWLERLRACGPDVRELIHDGRPTICAEDAAFAYVDAHAEHANIGFFFGAFLSDPAGLLEGAPMRRGSPPALHSPGFLPSATGSSGIRPGRC